jgi:hypothetical protein
MSKSEKIAASRRKMKKKTQKENIKSSDYPKLAAWNARKELN